MSFFDSLGSVANALLEGYCVRTPGSINFGGFGCMRSGDIAMCSFLDPLNSVGEIVETITSRRNITDTNELADALESWTGLMVVLPCSMTRFVRRTGTFPLLREILI